VGRVILSGYLQARLEYQVRGIHTTASVASEYATSSPGAGDECRVMPHGQKQVGKGPSRGTAAQKQLEPDGVWSIPAVICIWVKMETTSGHLSSLSPCCTVSILLC